MLEKTLVEPRRAVLTRAELVEKICLVANLSRTEARRVLDCFLDEASEALVKEGLLSLRGFAQFRVLDKNTRRALNPKTAEPVEIEARRSISFRAGKQLKAAVNARAK